MPGETTGFDSALKQAQSDVAAVARTALAPSLHADLRDAMAYALDGGKALRGFLVLETAGLYGLRAQAHPTAFAIECIHAYSLIHDDLPCMDDDDLRRGKPTVHKAWNEHTAVLAGDALQALAFETVGTGVPPQQALALSRSLAVASGQAGMVGGQMLDIAAESAVDPLTLEQISAVQAGKTGALIRWAAMSGALMAGEDPARLETYGDRLGLAFQIADDVLDVEGDADTVGKATQKDAEAGKATFVSLLGLDAAKARARDLVDEACSALEPYGAQADTLRAAARFVISRKK